ncbi:MAG: ATP-binding protein [Firmicutes bacterium]|nr:ATP-binding protein [Bacillota bacterium]
MDPVDMSLHLSESLSIEERAGSVEVSKGIASGHFEQILQAAEEGILSVDSRGIITYANPAAAYLLRYKAEELIGHAISERLVLVRVDGSSYAFADCPVHDTVAQGVTYMITDDLVCTRDGSCFAIEYSSTPIRDDTGVVGAVVTFRDVTARKVTDNLLRRHMQVWDRTQRFAHLGSWERDTRTQEVFWSDEAYRIFGLEPQSGMSCGRLLSFIHPEDVATVEHAMHELGLGCSSDIRYRIRRPDGEERIVCAQGEAVWQGNHVVQTFGIIQDVTDQECVKRRLQDSEELLRRSDQLSVAGELAAGLAHEIRNPLTALKGFAQLLGGRTADRERHYVEIMQGELERIEHITNELLMLAKPQVISRCTIDLAVLLEMAGELLAGQALMHKVSIVVRSAGALWVRADEAQLKQVLINIMKNAIEAMPDGGTLAITSTQDEREICVSFQDDGPGMPPEVVRRIGDPFFTTKTGGTGLGMMVSRRIVLDHGGMLRVESEQGHGTCVTLCLPRQQMFDT